MNQGELSELGTSEPSSSGGRRRPRGWSGQGLTSMIDALDGARGALTGESRSPESIGSIRRLALALAESDTLAEHYGVTQAASALELASDEDILEPLDQLLAGLRILAELPTLAKPGILIIEDDPILARLLESRLSGPQRRIFLAGSVREAEQILAEEEVSLVLLDLILPEVDGRHLLIRLRANPETAALPIFVVSCKTGPQTKTECFALGADGFFEKPLDLTSISAAVGATLERSAQTRGECRQDQVTGLPNRAAFHETFEAYRARAAVERRPLSLAILDLDHFGWVNDTYGRQMGEAVLRRVGARVALPPGERSYMARWEGGEFIALFPGLTPTEVGKVLEKVLQGVRRLRFQPSEGPEFAVTFSAGVAEVPPGASIEDAVSRADRLRYLAKTAGRNRIVTGDAAAPPTRRILFAEDDANVARLISRHLSAEGFEVLHYPDGTSAFAALPTSGASLVLSDVEMPGMDGFELLRQLRALPAFQHLPVMMLTAMGDESYIIRAFELGADDYVLKPFSTREVVARIRRLLRRPSVAGVAAAGD